MKLSLRFPRAAVALLCCLPAMLLGADDQAPAKSGYTVTVEIHANEKGDPESVGLYKSEDTSPGEVLNKMALAMAMKTQLPPQMKDGKAVRATVRAPFFFPVDDDEGPAAEALPKPRPKKESAVMPVYPPALREAGVVGGSVLELKVDAEGKLSSIRTLRASHPEFDASAQEAVNKWTFAPAMQEGKPVASRVRLAIVFENRDNMADLKWRIAPRPSLGSFVVIKPKEPIQDEAETAPAPAPAAPQPDPAAAPAPAK